MAHVNIWIRKENEDEWAAIGEKSLWVNQRLEEKRKGRSSFTTPMPDREQYRQEYSPVRNLAEANDQYDFYADLIFERATGKVWNKEAGEEETEVDKTVVDELKRRGQVR